MFLQRVQNYIGLKRPVVKYYCSSSRVLPLSHVNGATVDKISSSPGDLRILTNPATGNDT